MTYATQSWAAAVLAPFLFAAGCHTTDEVMTSHARFVDLREMTKAISSRPYKIGPDANGSQAISTVTILDETRYVLTAPATQPIVFEEAVPVPPDGKLIVDAYLHDDFRNSSSVALETRVRVKDVWESHATVVVPIALVEGRPHVTVAYDLAGSATSATAGLRVIAHALDRDLITTYRTRELTIPPRSRLEFATGITEPTQPLGDANFTVEICVQDACEPVWSELLSSPTGKVSPWHDHRVDLARFAGKSATFVFKTMAVGATQAYPAPVWANPTLYAPRARSETEVNVVLLSVDTLAAGHLPAYGYEHDTAPFMTSRFAEDGTVFEHCVAAATATSASHMAIFTGEQPSVNGVMAGLESLPPWLNTVTEKIRAATIDTAAVTEAGWLGVPHGFGRGFNVYAENESVDLMAPSGQVDETFGRAKRWLALNRDKRFFLFLHTFQVHGPYAPPEAYRGLFHDAPKSIAATAPHERERRAYDQEIRYTDDQIEELFAVLEDLGIDDQTVFILTSDHGEAFGQNGWVSHGGHIHEPVTHVPLMLTGPGVPAGERITEMVGHIDIAPTIAELFGVSLAPQGAGRSLVADLRANQKSADEASAAPYFTESWSPTAHSAEKGAVPFFPPAFGVHLGTRKIARYRGETGHEFEAFDLKNDPHETAPLDPDAADFRDLRLLLDDYERACQERRASLLRASGHTKAPADDHKLQLDPEQQQKLRALGYID